jgi:hypothetical protein
VDASIAKKCIIRRRHHSTLHYGRCQLPLRRSFEPSSALEIARRTLSSCCVFFDSVDPIFSLNADACYPSGDHDCGFDSWIDFYAHSKQMSCDSDDARPGLIVQYLYLGVPARPLAFANVTCRVVAGNLAVLYDGRKLAVEIRNEIVIVTVIGM